MSDPCTKLDMVSLKDYVVELIRASESRSDIKIQAAKEAAALLATAADKALQLAADSQTKSFASVNEFRGAMNDRERANAAASADRDRLFATIPVLEALEKKLDTAIAAHEKQLGEIRVTLVGSSADTLGRRAGNAPLVNLGMLVAGGIIAGIIGLLFAALSKGGTP